MVEPDELGPIWEGSTRRRLPFRAYLELLIRRFVFPGEIGIIWSIKAAARCRKIIHDHPQTNFVLVCTYPPLGVLLAGLFVWLRERVPWIADFRDPIAGFVWHQKPRYARIWDHVLERSVFRTAAAVVANVEDAAAVWRGRYPWARPKLHVICNGFDPEEAPRAREIPEHREKVLIHAGTLYEGRNPDVLLKAMFRLRGSGAPETSTVRFLLLGSVDASADLDSRLYDEAQRQGWLEMRATVPRDEALRIQAEADGLLLLQPQSGIQIPGKLFEYICIGRPVLALLPRSSPVTGVLEKSGVRHVCVHPDDEPEIVDQKLTDFLRLPSSPTRYSDWFGSSFNAEHQTGQLLSIIKAIA